MFPVSSDKSLLLRDSRDSADSRDTSQSPKKIRSIWPCHAMLYWKRAKLETEYFVIYSIVLFLFLSFSFFTLFYRIFKLSSTLHMLPSTLDIVPSTLDHDG